MLSSLKLKIALGLYVFLVVSIPIGAYLASQQQVFKSQAAGDERSISQIPSAVSPINEIENASTPAAQPLPTSSPTAAVSFGPTLNFKIVIEGRPTSDESGRVFVGIVAGNLTTNPKYLLSFTVDVPISGEYAGLSLAGLDSGSQYTAVIKGPAQIATSSAFVMSPAVTNLNNNLPLNLTTGDLNGDNSIDNVDYVMVKQALGSKSGDPNWNANADFDKNGAVNVFDLALVTKNMNKVGAGGNWSSNFPPIATSSSTLTPQTGGPEIQPIKSSGGYWMWVPGSL